MPHEAGYGCPGNTGYSALLVEFVGESTIDETRDMGFILNGLLRAYPNNPEALKAMRAQAKCRKAM